MIRLTLPWPPALNNLYFNLVRNGKQFRIPTSRKKEYTAEVHKICARGAIKPIDGDVVVTLRAYRPRKVGDLDGIFKANFDALTGWAWHDDKQITEIHAKRFEDKENPRVEIEIESAVSPAT